MLVTQLTFIVETVYSIDRSTLVIATQDKEIFRVLDFVCK